MSIEKIQLKNGNIYPVSPAYRTPVVSGHDMDYPFNLDLTDQTANPLVVTQAGDQTHVGLRITQTVLTQAELRKLTGNIVFGSGGATVGEYALHCSGTASVNALFTMLNALSDNPFVETIDEFPGNGAILTPLGSSVPLFVLSSSESGTFSHTETFDDESVTLSVTIPAAGTYLVFPADIIAVADAVSGTMTVAEYHLDERYAAKSEDLVVPLFAGLTLLSVGSFTFGDGFENLAAQAEQAATAGKQLNIVMEGNLPGVVFSAQTTALYLTPGEAEWALSITVQGTTYTGVSYNFATQVCTLITAE